ncbi:COP23 domain-containing protein [Okeania sp.]|uniref:COP23 domain-containing protein n=1 Tax=Okeania sp. TaxID=3100323 RepID=UPI002B4B7ADD|nr:COP23 domain-containing protein [Okeania sp.]MEB3340948.1 COP23 domain-containing protein [Okeania sp.]
MRQNIIILGIGSLGIGAFILGVLIAAGLGIDIVQGWPPLLVKKTDRFSCQLESDINQGKEVWTVMYDNNEGKYPWLGIVITMGGGWTPAERCSEIERRLENYRQDGLVKLTYRQDPETPEQDVICAITKSSNGCPLLLTLKKDVDGYEALREITYALVYGTTVYHNSEGKSVNSNFSRESPVVDLKPFLAREDKLAGDN